jgi:hypothetical protein
MRVSEGRSSSNLACNVGISDQSRGLFSDKNPLCAPLRPKLLLKFLESLMATSSQDTEDQIHNLTVERITADDAPAVRKLSERIYARINSSWSEKSFIELIGKFPEGQIVVKNHEEVVAFAFSLIVDYDKYGASHGRL